MTGTLIQISDSMGWVGLYWIADENLDISKIKSYYKQYLLLDDEDDFESWMLSEHPEVGLERVFTEEITI